MSLIYTDKIVRAACAEEVDVDTSVLREFFEKLDKIGYNFKNIMILRHGKVAAECTKYPYGKEFNGTMFSLSKPITAIAIGFAIEDGILRLDTTIKELFSDSFDEKDLSNVEGITVRHLLNMTAGIKLSVLDDKTKGDWLGHFIRTKPTAKPGEKFIYVSENTYVLGRMLAKVSGCTVSEYLRSKLFEPLGIETPQWNKDENGFEAGGWGLYLNIEDMAKIAQCFLQKGEWNGVQIIPRKWVEDMCVPYVRDLPSLFAKDFGFGYNTWCGGKYNQVRFEGLYGQYIIFFPDYDACIITSSGDINQHKMYNTVDEFFPKAFKENLQIISQDINGEFKKFLASNTANVIKSSPRNLATESGTNGKVYSMTKKRFATMLGISEQYFMYLRPGYMDNFCFDFKENYAEFSWTEKNYGKNTIYISLDGERRISNVKLGEIETHVAAFGAWNKNGTFEFQVFEMEVPEIKTFLVAFYDNKIDIRIKVKTNLYEMVVFEFTFKGFKVNFFFDFLSKCAGLFGNISFYPARLKGKIKKKHRDE